MPGDGGKEGSEQVKRSAASSPAYPEKPTLFLARLYEMVDEPKTDSAIQWTTAVSASNNPGPSAFTIVDNMLLEKHWLPKYYKHANFTSFVRQLNQYQFRKLESKRWTFGHECFVKRQPELLPRITRKRKEPTSAERQQKSQKGAAASTTCGVAAPAPQPELEACVKQLSKTLQRVVDQQAEMQQQINYLSQRVAAANATRLLDVKKEHPDTAVGVVAGSTWNALNHQDNVVEFSDIDIPTTDIDTILSPAKQDEGLGEKEQGQHIPPPPPLVKKQQDLPPEKQEPPHNLEQHPLQLPRPSTLFQIGY